MASGVSVVGPQTVLTWQDRNHKRIGLAVEPFTLITPYRVGFAYILQIGGGGASGAHLIDRWPVYSPGNYRSIPELGYGDGSSFGAIVVWNEAGIEWDCVTF